MSFAKIAHAVVIFTIAATANADTTKITNPLNNHAYQRFDTKKAWTNARLSCESQGGYLATITSQSENDWIVKELITTAKASSIWIGGTDAAAEGNWKWRNGEEWGYTNWHTGEPNNAGNENVLTIYAPYGTWNDWGAKNSRGTLNRAAYICEWSPYPVASGTIHGLASKVIYCINETTGQTAQLDTAAKSEFNCESAGLITSSSDTVTIKITGKIK